MVRVQGCQAAVIFLGSYSLTSKAFSTTVKEDVLSITNCSLRAGLLVSSILSTFSTKYHLGVREAEAILLVRLQMGTSAERIKGQG